MSTAPTVDLGGVRRPNWSEKHLLGGLQGYAVDASVAFRTVSLVRLSEKSLGTPNWALMNRWKGTKRPFLGPRVGKKYARGLTLTSFQTVSRIGVLGNWASQVFGVLGYSGHKPSRGY